MSKVINQQVNCPKCRSVIDKKLWISVNPQLAPSLRKKIMDESLFDFCCPKCKYKSQLEYPFIYNDIKNNFILYFIPSTNKNKIYFNRASKEYPQLNNKKKRLVKELNQVKEKIIIFENNLDDRAIELTKYSLNTIIRNKSNKYVSDTYFCMLDKDAGKIGFSFFFDDRKKPLYHSTTIEAYNKYASTIEKTKAFDELKTSFLSIDQNWVETVLAKK